MESVRGKITLGKVTSAFIIILILLILNAPAIIPFVESISVPSKPEIVGIQFSPSYNIQTNTDLRGYAQSSTGVSGYSANVYISFENTNVAIGGLVKMQIQINNIGTTLQNPYFYIVLVNNTGNAVSVFPQYAYFQQYSSYKPLQWSESQYGRSFFTPQLSNGLQSNLAIPRQTMITSYGDFWNNNIKHTNGEISFEKQIPDDPSQIGQWTVWVFVFDDPYTDSLDRSLSSNNAIAYSTSFFNVTPLILFQNQAQVNTTSTSLFLASGLISFILAAISVFPLFKKLSPWIDTRVHAAKVSGWWKSNKNYIIISSILLVVYLIFFLLRI